MKLLRFASRDTAGSRLGVLAEREVHDLTALDPQLNDVADWLRLPEPSRQALLARLDAAPRHDLAALRLLTPVARPGKFICLGLNYRDHAAEGGHAAPEYPAFFMRGASSLLAPGAPLQRPRCSDHLDFEAELAVLIGRSVRHCSEADALQHVGGYTVFNDGTLRDYQRRSSQWTIGKNFDATGPFGPWVVTPDELPEGAAGLRIQSRLNGRVMQDANTGSMIVTVAQAITLLAECLTLEMGYARTPPVFMRAGDRIEIEIERIGVLSNPVEDEA